MMDDKNRLLEKYWEGETSLEEERLLKEYYSSDKSELSTNAIFSFFEKEKKIRFENEFANYKSKNYRSDKPDKKVIKLSFIRKLAVAASIVIIVGIGFLLNNNFFTKSNSQLAKYEIKDQKEARDLAEKAIAMLAVKYNEGEATVMKNIKNLDKINIVNSNQ